MDWGTALETLLVEPGDEEARAWADAAVAAGSCTPGQRRAYELALEGADVLAVLERSPAQVRELIADRSLIDVAPAPGEWSARQVVGHLADNEIVNGVRIRSVLTEDEPELFGYDSDDWTPFFDVEDVDTTLHRWEVLRANTLALVRRLSPEELSRRGVISYRGPESLRILLAVLAGHDRDHLNQIREALAAARERA
jgi:DinB superfamily